MHIKTRTVNAGAYQHLLEAGVAPLLARLYAARGVVDKSELETSLAGIIPPEQLTNSAEMAKLLANAIYRNKKILVIGDFLRS